MFYLACSNIDICGKLSETSESQDSVVSVCPYCLSPAIIFKNKVNALIALNKNDLQKEADFAALANTIKKTGK